MTVLLSKISAERKFLNFSEQCMGTRFSIIIDEDSFEKARVGAKAAFQEAHRLNRIFSDYDADSEISQFVQNAEINRYVKISNQLAYLLNESQKLAHETDGSFDITVGPLSRMWRISRFRKNLPERPILEKTLDRVGYQNLLVDFEKNRAKLLRENMIIDLGGIAKGYTADCMLKVLKAHDLNRSLVDAGGDLVLGNPPRNKKGWKIEIGGRKHPKLPILHLSNTAIATSGDLEQYLKINDVIYSHLINPHTGVGMIGKSQVTVIAPSGLVADSLASSMIVMGIEKSEKLIRSKKQISAYFLNQNGEKIHFHKLSSLK